MAFDFTGKKILITGAGRGIGKELTLALAKTGCHVFALSRTESTLVKLKEECPSITPIVLDISNWDETRKVLESLDAMDGVVNNAATYASSPLPSALTAPKDDFDKILNTNLLAAINIIQIFSKKMIDNGIKGSIVNMSSVLSKQAMQGTLPYAIAKASLDMVSKQFALELGPHGIRVNSINPTLVMTVFIKQLVADGKNVDAKFLKRTPMGRLPETSEVVEPILYLLSEYSSAVTGTTHIVDCGLLSNISL